MEDKKERIVRAAIDVLCSKGIEKTKVSDIVKGAGIAQGTFYLYFPSKLAVMPSIAEIMVNKILDALQNTVHLDAPIEVQLKSFIETVFQLHHEDRDQLALLYAGLASSEYLKEWESIYAPYYSWVTALLDAAQSNGWIREKLNTARTARLVIGAIESAAEQVFLFGQADEAEIEEQAEVVYAFVAHALGIKVL
ncbi:TetR family transcriptional regulator [Paenibacillus sp. 1001270B_150601_E10]|uniref:TetR family transcriptional regulator n=1 Tax=Paenibacillus sp. 1001270B_150601_E10 TaxID=2787079 RepID=UPI00189D82E6|nr:TetR family transcriptional regulator [Paenibacillus sp. 1001270B_150601_E10]